MHSFFYELSRYMIHGFTRQLLRFTRHFFRFTRQLSSFTRQLYAFTRQTHLTTKLTRLMRPSFCPSFAKGKKSPGE